MKLAVMGFGTVGSGVVELIDKNRELLLKRTGADEIYVKRILDLRDFPGSPYADRLTKSFEDIVNDDEIELVVETMGGVNPAFDFVTRCIKKGKSVVTSNKELVAQKGNEIIPLAKKNDVNFMFEAAVGGGIPVLRPLMSCLSANDIVEITGILNGTTNFILTKMIREGMSFDDALLTAQKNGYAERDPSADIDGHDACRKISILASILCGTHIFPAEVHTEGIRDIKLADAKYAAAGKYAIKLLGTASRMSDGRLYCIVRPAFVQITGQLASVNGVFNEILVRGDAVGDVIFYGQGAGKFPTASAVVGDVTDCMRTKGSKIGYGWDDHVDGMVGDYLDRHLALYVRGSCEDALKAQSELSEVFESLNYLSLSGMPRNELAFITEHDKERTLREKLGRLRTFRPESVIRVEDNI